MFDLKRLSDDFEFYRSGWARRGQPQLLSQVAILQGALQKRKETIRSHEELLALRNKASQEIARKKRSGEDAAADLEQQKQVGENIKTSEIAAKQAQDEFDALVQGLPNIPQNDVPQGQSADENKEVHRWGVPKTFEFEVLSHEVLGEKRGWFDFERAATITGARFSVSKGAAAKLERVLIQFMLDIHTTQHGYTEVVPPFIVNDKTLFGTGNLPKFKEDLFKLEGTNYFLIPTSEAPLTNLHAGTTLREQDLPFHYTAYSPCFRSEAGSYGKDLKGLIRQHQFNKVELVKICHPEQSNAEHEAMRMNAQKILEALELPYRTVVLCTGDMGFAATKTYDLEVWLPSQKNFREISSVSNCGDFQARRMNTRFKDYSGKTQYVHTLNGSGLAVGRTLIAILENYQNADGSVTIPGALRSYFGGADKI